MATNTAAYLVTTNEPLEIKSAPHPTPKEHEIVIKNHAVAINPVDWAIQLRGPEYFKFVTLPKILGYDVAGEVEAVGSAVTRFKVGDRVAGLTDGGFQEHVLLPEHITTAVPDSIAWEQAAVLPMGVSVAVKSLFHKDLLALDHPVLKPTPKGETVLIWGGSTSVGSCAIQLAVAAGYEVISTASPHNFAYVKELGASQVFDYNSPSIKDDLVAAFKGKTTAGAVANGGFGGIDGTGPGVVEACVEAIKSCPGKHFVSMTMVPSWGPSFEGVELKFVEPLWTDVDLASGVFHDFLSDALADGVFKPMPEPEVVGHGLEAIQGGMDLLKKGVSRKKLVVTL